MQKHFICVILRILCPIFINFFSMPSIKEYYDHTRFDYRTIWFGSDNLSIHFGYYDDKATHHHAALANMNRKLAEFADIKAGELVLDAGCGAGGAGP